ncbi:MAG: hypothetical protein GWP91_19740 [Rhodobacterales bacterium]|nr:hypothetical protein [Rhodobacterales bacterium]
MNRCRHSSLLSIALFLFPTSARAQFVIDYEGDRFCSQQSEVSLIDAASWTGTVPDCYLQLVETVEYRGAAWYNVTFDPSQFVTIQTRFQLEASGGTYINGYEGFVFVLQSQGASAIGSATPGIGYEGITPSVGIEFDTYEDGFDPSDNHIGVNVNGDSNSTLTIASPIDINNGSVYFVWIDFQVVAQTVEIFVSAANSKPASPTLTQVNIDLTALGASVYAGFTAASGSYGGFGTGNNHTVRSWYLEGLSDSDGDGVFDSVDVCPGFDDALDSDGDGVPDGCDVCVGDDASDDTDGDGTCDDLDPCPDLASELDSDGDGFIACYDCDDNVGTVFPGAIEGTADGIDQDCDGYESCYTDVDGDGWGVPILVLVPSLDCSALPGSADNALDCDDRNQYVNPGATEIPGDAVDEDCDGVALGGTGTTTGTTPGIDSASTDTAIADTGDALPQTPSDPNSTRTWAPADIVPNNNVIDASGCACQSSPVGWGGCPLLVLGLLLRRRNDA